MEPAPPVAEVWHLNHWPTWKLLSLYCFLKAILVRCNLHTITFTHLKCEIQCFLVNLPTFQTSPQFSFRTFSSSVWITANCGKFLKIWEHQTTLPVSCMWVRKQLLEPYMEQLTSLKVGKEYDTGVYCYPAYLTSIHITLCKMPDWMNHKLESRLRGKISTTSHMQVIPL